MLIRIVYAVAILLALLTLALPGRGGIQAAAVAVACLTAILAAIEAGRIGRYLWVSGFMVMVLLLNPILPLALGPGPALALLGVSLAMVASWMIVLSRTIPSQSIAEVLYPQERR